MLLGSENLPQGWTGSLQCQHQEPEGNGTRGAAWAEQALAPTCLGTAPIRPRPGHFSPGCGPDPHSQAAGDQEESSHLRCPCRRWLQLCDWSLLRAQTCYGAPALPRSERAGAQPWGSLGSRVTAQAKGWAKTETPYEAASLMKNEKINPYILYPRRNLGDTPPRFSRPAAARHPCPEAWQHPPSSKERGRGSAGTPPPPEKNPAAGGEGGLMPC